MVNQKFIHNSLIDEVLYNNKLKVKTEINYKKGIRTINFRKLFDYKFCYTINTSYNINIHKWEYEVLCNGKKLVNDEIYYLYAEINCIHNLN